MRYAYEDLGLQEAGTSVTLRLKGSSPNVLLLDAQNFTRYRASEPFSYTGGHFARSPVVLEIPRDGHWYVVVDLGGYKGRVTGTVEVQASGSADSVLTHIAA